MPNRFGHVVTPVFSETAAHDFAYCGSAVLAQISSEFWLLTAAHVFADFATAPLLVPGGVNGFVHLTGHVAASCKLDPETPFHDPLDLVYVRLANVCAEALKAAGLSFLPENSIEETDSSLSLARCVVTGFPEKCVVIDEDARTARVRIFQLNTQFFADTNLRAARLNPSIHVVARYDHFRGPDGKPAKRYQPKGLSGGAIWAPLNAEMKLVGIITDFDPKQNTLLGKRLRPMLEDIRVRIGVREKQ